MRKRHHMLPRLWLMTDERMGSALLPSIAALPARSGIIFRHYHLPLGERRALFEQVKKRARRHRHTLILAGSPRLAAAWGADGAHGRMRGCVSAPVHSVVERIAAERQDAQLIFVSPVFETASHAGLKGLGAIRFAMMVRGARAEVVALGGMTQSRANRLSVFGIYGWAAIDALTSKPD